MKTLERRGFLQQLGGFVGILPSTGAICSPIVSKLHKRRIGQRELEDAVDLHAIWLEDDKRGPGQSPVIATLRGSTSCLEL
jgi:hypothetical protein